MPRGKKRMNNDNQPVTTPVDTVPEPVVAPIQSVESPIKHSDLCWNCKKELDSDNIHCSHCGFDKSLIYNLDLEAARAVERQLSATK